MKEHQYKYNCYKMGKYIGIKLQGRIGWNGCGLVSCKIGTNKGK